jgi:hypothetical protein
MAPKKPSGWAINDGTREDIAEADVQRMSDNALKEARNWESDRGRHRSLIRFMDFGAYLEAREREWGRQMKIRSDFHEHKDLVFDEQKGTVTYTFTVRYRCERFRLSKSQSNHVKQVRANAKAAGLVPGTCDDADGDAVEAGSRTTPFTKGTTRAVGCTSYVKVHVPVVLKLLPDRSIPEAPKKVPLEVDLNAMVPVWWSPHIAQCQTQPCCVKLPDWIREDLMAHLSFSGGGRSQGCRRWCDR